MATREKMTIDERYKVIRNIKAKYQRANRAEKSQILDTLVEATGLGRKYLITTLKGVGPQRKRRRRQRGRKYGAAVDDAIRIIGSTLDWICAERFTPVLAEMALHLARHGEMMVDNELLDLLATISISTVRRIVKRVRQDEYRLPQRRGKPRYRNSVTDQIPMNVIPWDVEDPGHFEVDLVHHGGPNFTGDCVYTIQFIDVKTGWSERLAVLGRSYSRIQEAFSQFETQCPIPVREIHSDNGPEFINAHLLHFFTFKFQGASFCRSRPWQKNDNRFVEQKNYTLVRAYLGRTSFTTQQEVNLLNELYGLMRVYYNFFQPVLRQTERSFYYDQDHAPILVRKQDTARTPLKRLLESNVLDQDAQQRLLHIYEQTNPRLLRRQIQQILDALFNTHIT